jgi:hypothetical protein
MRGRPCAAVRGACYRGKRVRDTSLRLHNARTLRKQFPHCAHASFAWLLLHSTRTPLAAKQALVDPASDLHCAAAMQTMRVLLAVVAVCGVLGVAHAKKASVEENEASFAFLHKASGKRRSELRSVTPTRPIVDAYSAGYSITNCAADRNLPILSFLPTSCAQPLLCLLLHSSLLFDFLSHFMQFCQYEHLSKRAA